MKIGSGFPSFNIFDEDIFQGNLYRKKEEPQIINGERDSAFFRQ